MRHRLGRLLGVLLLAGILGFGAGWFATPPVDDVQSRVAALAGHEHTTPIAPAAVPRQLALAVVTTEDERFYSHHGIDVIGIGRSLIDDARMGCLCEGGSTLTQQLVKEVYLGGNDRGMAKLTDIVMAFKVETVLDKSQIMADWLTLAPTGPTLYGAGTGACVYFGRPLGSLDLAQYALLAGLPQSPSLDEPRLHPDNALRRRAQVLDAMVADSYITPAQAEAAKAEPLLATGGTCFRRQT